MWWFVLVTTFILICGFLNNISESVKQVGSKAQEHAVLGILQLLLGLWGVFVLVDKI